MGKAPEKLTGEGIHFQYWMDERYDKIKDKYIWNIALPGTHNTGIFAAANTIGVRAQTKNIKEQLHDGIRMFDLRIRHAGDYYMAHANIHHVSQKFFEAIQQIKEFLDAYRGEIVVMTISSESDEAINGMTVERRTFVHSHILDIMGRDKDSCLAPPGNGLISSLIELNTRAIIISDYPERSQPAFANYFWANTGAMLHSTYQKYQGAKGCTIKEKYDQLKKDLPRLMDERMDYPRFYKVDLDLWTVNIADSAQHYQHPLAADLFSSDAKNQDKAAYVIDFYEKSNYVEQIINKNI